MPSAGEVTKAEAVAVLGQFQEAADWLAANPFAESDRISIGEVLMWRVILALPMLSGEHAAQIAQVAARDVEPDGARRVLIIGWRYSTPRIAWLSGDITADLTHPLLILPVAHLLEDLTTRIAEHRCAAGRPN